MNNLSELKPIAHALIRLKRLVDEKKIANWTRQDHVCAKADVELLRRTRLVQCAARDEIERLLRIVGRPEKKKAAKVSGLSSDPDLD